MSGETSTVRNGTDEARCTRRSVSGAGLCTLLSSLMASCSRWC